MIASSLYPAFSRNFDDEQDYADAAILSARHSSRLPLSRIDPILRWKRQLSNKQQQSNLAQKKKFETLVVAFGSGGGSFALKCFGLSEADWIGTLVLPGATPAESTTKAQGLGDSLDPTDPYNSACNIFTKKDRKEGGNDRNGGVAVVLCGYRVPPARAQAWTRALLGGVEAEVVVTLTTVGIEPGRCEGWEGARLLATSQAEERADCLEMSAGFQPLPTPTMLSGPSAALVSHCQRHGLPAMCFAVAELPGRWTQRGPAVERALSAVRKPLALLAGSAMVSREVEGPPLEKGPRKIDSRVVVDDVMNSLYV